VNSYFWKKKYECTPNTLDVIDLIDVRCEFIWDVYIYEFTPSTLNRCDKCDMNSSRMYTYMNSHRVPSHLQHPCIQGTRCEIIFLYEKNSKIHTEYLRYIDVIDVNSHRITSHLSHLWI